MQTAEKPRIIEHFFTHRSSNPIEDQAQAFRYRRNHPRAIASNPARSARLRSEIFSRTVWSENETEENAMARILVVDDEQHICDFYKTELTEMGHTVRSVSDGNNLLGKIEMFDPQLVILDIKLGAQNGLDLLCKIREKYSDLPVVMSTAYDSYKSERKALAADYYVVKSIDLSELKQSINRALEADITVKS